MNTRIFFVSKPFYFQVISEEKEHVEPSSFIKKTPLYNQEVDSLVGDEDELVDAKDITVWIDPLDATKEYTGERRVTIVFKLRVPS